MRKKQGSRGKTGNRTLNDKPNRVDVLTRTARAAWEALYRVPDELALYGGTAVALYLGHRESKDLDFATDTKEVNEDTAKRIRGIQLVSQEGGGGMVDAVFQTKAGRIKVTFMETGHLIPRARRKPVDAGQGRKVAHPVDLIASKAFACMSRGEPWDYVDLAYARKEWQQWWDEGIKVADAHSQTEGKVIRCVELAPRHIAEMLSEEEKGWLKGEGIATGQSIGKVPGW